MLDAALLAVLTALAAALRLFRLDLQSLWNDELASWHQTHWPTLAQVLERGVIPDVHPPAYFLLLHLWTRVVGESEAALRAPSALFGLLTVPAIYGLGRCLYSRREGLVAAAITAVAWMPVYYSREARPYALLILCAVVSTWWLVETVRGLEETGRLHPGFAAGYVVAAAVAAYTHYFGLLFVALQGTVAGLRLLPRPRALLRLLAPYAALTAAYAPWIPHLAEDLGRRSFWIKEPEPGALLELYRFELGRWDALAVLVAAILAVALARWIAVDARGRQAGKALKLSLVSPTALLLLWLLAPPLIAWARSQVSTPVFTLRNLVLTAPALYLLIARSLTRLAPSRPALALAATGLCAMLLFDLGVRRHFYRTPTKEQWREAVQRVATDRRFSRAPIFVAALDPAYFQYYLRRCGQCREVALVVSARDVGDLERTLERTGATRFWYLQIHRKATRGLRRYLERTHRLVREDELVGATVQLWAVGDGP